jgi:hypothetical protein
MLMATPFVFDGITAAQTDTISQNFNTVTGATSVNITLGQALYSDTIASVVEISSNDTADSPTAYSYNSVSRILTVSGLDAGPRTLAVEFRTDDATLPAYGAGFLGILRWFWILLMIGFTGAAIYAFTQS